MASSLTSTLGEEVFGKIFDAINSDGFNVLEDLTFGSPNPYQAIRMSGRTYDEFWESLQSVFNPTEFEVNPPRFKIPGTNTWISTHISTNSGEITVTIGNLKFRF